MTVTALAIDVGATKVVVGRVRSDGSVLDRRRFPTAAARTGDELFEMIVAAADELDVASAGDIACGVGTAGPVLHDGDAVSPLNIAVWRSFPLRSRLEARLGLPTVVEMDGLSITRAEGWVGAARGSANYTSLIVSTGVGGGIVLDGRLIRGASGNAGHIGHIPVEPDGRPCVCGGRGCLEAEVSGVAIERVTGRPPAEAPPAVRQRCARLVGRAVGSMANLLDVEVVTLSGSVALGFGPEFVEGARAGATETATLPFARGLRIDASPLGADGPLLGAAAAVLQPDLVRTGS